MYCRYTILLHYCRYFFFQKKIVPTSPCGSRAGACNETNTNSDYYNSNNNNNNNDDDNNNNKDNSDNS